MNNRALTRVDAGIVNGGKTDGEQRIRTLVVHWHLQENSELQASILHAMGVELNGLRVGYHTGSMGNKAGAANDASY